jgi:two-component system, NtrC family, sensor kinase
MKLYPKLTIAIVAATTAILSVGGYVRIRREVDILRLSRERDHRMFGRALVSAVTAEWRNEGAQGAETIVAGTNAQAARLHARWIALDIDPAPIMHVDLGALDHLEKGGPRSAVTVLADDDHGEPSRFTYLPVEIEGTRRGVLELSESLVYERAFVRRAVIDTVTTTCVLVFVNGIVSLLLGFWLVGRPVRSLADKARRIGRGDFADPIKLTRKDELTELADEMNAMCERLVEANDRAGAETRARIATLEQLRHSDRLMTVGKLASGIAHELGTPLNVVSARAQMIARGEANADEAKDYARVIVDSSERMAKIIRQLLEFARRKSVAKTQCDVGKVAQSTLDLLQPLADKGGVRVVVSDGAGATARADAGLLQQAFANLLVNAMQAMPSGGDVTVSVAREHAVPPPGVDAPEGDYVSVRVKDGGTGIDAAHIEHVFEPFFTTKDVGEGTGLGLSVTYGIIRDHGGWISVDSAVGDGTTFTVYLPEERAT